MKLIRYAKPHEYKKAYKTFKLMGQPESVPKGFTNGKEIVLFKKYIVDLQDMGDVVGHEIRHNVLGHEEIMYSTEGDNKGKQAQSSLQEFEVLYLQKFQTGAMDKDQLKFERQVATHNLGSPMAKDLEKLAEKNVKERLQLK